MNSKYTHEKLDIIAEEMINFLMEQEDGYVDWTSRLANEMGYGDIDFDDLFYLNDKVFELAEKNGITLDMSEHEGKLEGLPFNLTFIVRKGRPAR